MYKYFITVFLFAILPGAFFIIKYWKDKKNIFLTAMLIFAIAFTWEYIVINLGILTYNPNEVITFILKLPLEEYLFFIFGSFEAIGLYKLLGERFGGKDV